MALTAFQISALGKGARGVIDLPPPPEPPFDIETFESPWHAIREWIPNDEPEQADWFD